MKPTDILTQNDPLSILTFGDAGSGKTALWSQLSGAFCFDFDNGMRTAAMLKDKFFDARQKIEFERYVDANALKPVAYMRAKKKLMEFVGMAAAGKSPFDAFILDSLTGMCRAAQLAVQALGDKNNPMKDPLAKMEIQNWHMEFLARSAARKPTIAVPGMRGPM